MVEKEKYYLFVDECGDPFLDIIDENFPIFTLCGVIVSRSQLEALEAKVSALKAHFWGEKEIVLHSRDIRKHQRGFEILLDPEIKRDFYERVNAILGEKGAFTIVSCSIRKASFIEKNGKDDDIYGIALSRVIERSIFFLDEVSEDKGTDLSIIMEMRGKREDRELASYYESFRSAGTKWLTPARLNAHLSKFSFRSKKSNLAGLQVADLVAYPITRYVLSPNVVNLAYDVLQVNIFTDKSRKRLGLKIIPKYL